jgi:hypothetical protein
MDDIATYGAAEIGEAFYFVRQGGSFGPTVATIRIDPLGNVHTLATTPASAWPQDELNAMPTREEAIQQHLAPAFAQAEARLKAEVERRRREGPPPEPAPPPMDPATRRFMSDYEGVW